MFLLDYYTHIVEIVSTIHMKNAIFQNKKNLNDSLRINSFLVHSIAIPLNIFDILCGLPSSSSLLKGGGIFAVTCIIIS